MNKDRFLAMQRRYGSDASIAKVIGMTRQRVQQIRSSLGIPGFDNSVRNKIILLESESNQTGVDIAEKWGLSPSTVYGILKEEKALLGRRKEATDKNTP